MPRMRGQTPGSQDSFTSDDFYTASRAAATPAYRPSRSGQTTRSGYATPELEAAARPYADIGKVDLNLFDPLGGPGLPADPSQTPPPMPNAHQIMGSMQLPWMDAEKGESIGGIPGMEFVGGALDVLSNVTGGQSTKATPMAQMFRDTLANTPDAELTEIQRQTKNANAGLFDQVPDSPLMEGKQVGEMFRQFQIAEAHAKGSSAQLMALPGTSSALDDAAFIGPALQGYTMLSNMLRRAVGSLPWADQLNELKNPDATVEKIGEERWEIREQLLAGEINDEEARDLIAMSGFAISNPNPIGGQADSWGPVDTVANAALALFGEFVTDPLSAPTVVATGGSYLAAKPVQTTLRSVTRSIAEEGVTAAAKAAGKTTTEYLATAAGQELRQTIINDVTKRAADLAKERVGREAIGRYLPKADTALAKQTGKVSGEAINDRDMLEALLDMGGSLDHEWSAAIKRGVQRAGTPGQLATRAPTIIKTAQAIDKIVDPFSLFGYWKTGRTVPVAMSKMASHGYLDALGWRTVRRLDETYRVAGVDPERAAAGRGIAGANHTIQAGDRANTRRMVGTNAAVQSSMSPTELAAQHASRRPGDIRGLVRTNVDRTLEFIVPATKGGYAEALEGWRQRAAKQLVDMGAEEGAAKAASRTMDERQMRALANDHWGLMIDTLDAAKRASGGNAKWSKDGIDKITFMGPRQMSAQQGKALAQAVKDGNVAVVRAAVSRFSDLSDHISESLTDAEILAAVGDLLKQFGVDKKKGALPTAIEDLASLPQELADFVRDHPDYQLFLRPDDDQLLIPIRNSEGNITGVKTWVDNVTERTPRVEVTRAKAWREGMFRGITGGEIERNAQRRFAANMAEYAGLSPAESDALMRAIRQGAEVAGSPSPRGLTSDGIIAAVDNAVLPPMRIAIAKRVVQDALFEAYENEARLIGVTPKLTGWIKTRVSGVGGNAMGWATDYLYPTVRFAKSPLFFVQELPEAAFFLSLMGRYPISNVVPDVVARGLERVPGVGRKIGGAIAGQKENTRVWNEKTQIVMDRMTRSSPNAEYDAYEASELVRMGLTVAGQLTDRRTKLGRMLERMTGDPLPLRKQKSVALAFRKELGEQWRRALQANSPESWAAVRAFYPDEMSDGEVSIQWVLDLMSRSDPDSVYSKLSPNMFNPSHIGRRAEVSDQLIRHFVYGEADAMNHTWADLTTDIREGRVSIDKVRRDLMSAGADHDYVERAVQQLEFGTPDEFYDAAIANGIHSETAARWRAADQAAADLQDIGLGEYLSRNYAGRPMSTDQMGNIVGDTLFDDIVQSMRTRGKHIPGPNDPETAALMTTSREMIEGVFPETPVPARMPKGTLYDARKAAEKVRGWENTRKQREANPELHSPPTRTPPRKGEPVEGYDLHFEEDPFLGFYDREGRRFSDIDGGSTGLGRTVQVTDKDGKVVGFIAATMDEEAGTIKVAQSQVLDPHGRKGIANWMYRQLEEKTGLTVVQGTEQSPTARALWAQTDRPFGPQTRTLREYKTANERGTLVGGQVEMRDPNALTQTGRIPQEGEDWDAYAYLDAEDVKDGIREPIRITPEGKIIDGNDRRMAAINAGMTEVPVQVMSWPKGGEPLYSNPTHTIGRVTPQQYRDQIVAMMDPEVMSERGMRAITQEEANNAIEWYDHSRRAMFALVDESLTGEERILAAARILIAFGTTQLNTSPADGYRHVFKAMGMKARGETLQMDEAQNIIQQAVGLNPQQLHALVWNQSDKVQQFGLGQKLFDFIDSLTGAKLRTNGIRGPKGDWGPVAVDVHTKRDFGYLDDSMVDWVHKLVEKRGPGGKLIRGKSATYKKGDGYRIQMEDGTEEWIGPEHIGQGAPTDGEYDYGVELGNEIRDYFNETNFMERQWSSYEVQAIGWYRMQVLKSSEGDQGAVANALFEQSRWMGSHDLVPSANAPMHEVNPWDVLHPNYHRAIHVEGAYHASDEAEEMTGARALTKMDADAVVGGTHRPAQTVELMTDPTGAEQYLAHYLYLAEQDSGILMRDYVGKAADGAPHYDRGVGISVDIPVRDIEHGKELLERLAADEGGPLRAIGSHSFIARGHDGSLHIRTLWQPGSGPSNRNAFNKTLTNSKLGAALAGEVDEAGQPLMPRDVLVDFVSMSHDWKADPTGKTYTDVIQRGSGKHGVMRTPEQRAELVEKYDQLYLDAKEAAAKAGRMRDSNPKKAAAVKAADKALKAAKKEMEVARAAPSGRSSADVSELVGAARLRVRETVRSGFDKYASREVRNERERVLGEARDAAGDSLGTDPRWDDVLDLPGARGSNGERLYERTPGGTVRAAVSRADTADRRAQLYFNRGAVTPKSLLHELIHKDAWQFDDSANRVIAGVFNGMEGTPYGTWTPGTPLTEAQHEWLVSQYFLWAESEGSVHPTMGPLLKHLHGQLGSQASLRTQATAPAREAIKRIDGEIARLQAKKATLKSGAAIKRVDDQITGLQQQKAAARAEQKAMRASGGLSPAVKDVLDELAAKAGKRESTRASTYNADEQNMLEWAQIAMSASQKRANDLVHMRGERSAFERSINHPFLLMYPTSYMYGKVLPYMAEFLMARPFGMKAPFVAYTMGQTMHQSFERQQQYDSELRNYLYKNEPFLRSMSLFVPGLPWDLPSGFAFWQRRIMENWMTNQVRRMNGQKEIELNIPDLIANSAMFNLTLRGPDSWEPILDAANPMDDSIDPATGQPRGLSMPKGIQAIGGAMSGQAPNLAQPQQP